MELVGRTVNRGCCWDTYDEDSGERGTEWCFKADFCAMLPCQNEGTCENGEGEYVCKCTDEWTGKNCSERITTIGPSTTSQLTTNMPSTTESATITPPTTEPETTTLPTTVPKTITPPTTKPETTIPPTTKPETTISPTTKPETTMPLTTIPETITPPTTNPETTMPPTTKPKTTMPPTTKPETTMPPTTKPETTTAKPDTTTPPTTKPDTTTPPTTEPDTSTPTIPSITVSGWLIAVTVTCLVMTVLMALILLVVIAKRKSPTGKDNTSYNNNDNSSDITAYADLYDVTKENEGYTSLQHLPSDKKEDVDTNYISNQYLTTNMDDTNQYSRISSGYTDPDEIQPYITFKPESQIFTEQKDYYQQLEDRRHGNDYQTLTQ